MKVIGVLCLLAAAFAATTAADDVLTAGKSLFVLYAIAVPCMVMCAEWCECSFDGDLRIWYAKFR